LDCVKRLVFAEQSWEGAANTHALHVQHNGQALLQERFNAEIVRRIKAYEEKLKSIELRLEFDPDSSPKLQAPPPAYMPRGTRENEGYQSYIKPMNQKLTHRQLVVVGSDGREVGRRSLGHLKEDHGEVGQGQQIEQAQANYTDGGKDDAKFAHGSGEGGARADEKVDGAIAIRPSSLDSGYECIEVVDLISV
jgi:hypothetical protein